MTRETKIGLLVGLGFIVVFAVLLSHNGTGPSPVQALPPVAVANPTESPQSPSATLTPPPVTEQPDTTIANNPDTAEGPGEWHDAIDGQTVANRTGNDLPAPQDFERPGVIRTGNSADDTNLGMGLADAGTPRDGTLESTRVVPPVVEPPVPEPTTHVDLPAVTTPPPETNIEPGAATPEQNGAPGGSSHAVTAPPQPYVVHKGDTLVKITKEHYGKSTPDVISLVVDANKGTVKGRDSLRDGQTILLPALPADMFEKTGGSAATPDMNKVEQLINPADRHGQDGTKKAAPKNPTPGRAVIPGVSPATTSGATYVAAGGPKNPLPANNKSAAGTDNKAGTTTDNKKSAGAATTNGKNDKTTDKADAAKSGKDSKDSKKGATTPPKTTKPSLREYEIQPKDTFTSIAQRELGSRARVAEIKQLNQGIDPAKMKPGMKIKIPTRQPLSGDVTTRQVTA